MLQIWLHTVKHCINTVIYAATYMLVQALIEMSQIRLHMVKHCINTVIYAATYVNITHYLIWLFTVKYCIHIGCIYMWI